MRKSIRNLMSVVLALVMCMSFGGLTAFAEDSMVTGAQEAPAAIIEGDASVETNPDDAPNLDVDLDGEKGDEAESEAESGDEAEAEADGETALLASLPSVAMDEGAGDGDVAPVADPALPAGSPVYVNGTSGSDDNPGTKEAPVKTFAKAKELLGTTGGSTIYVSGALEVSGTDTWGLDGKTLMRAEGYGGELVHVGSGASLTLQDIVVDGGIENGTWAKCTGTSGNGGSLVGVFGGGSLTVSEGATLQNNYIQSVGCWYPEAGGAVFAKDSGTTVNVTGGTIRNNSAVRGGGIYGCDNAIINVSGGTITGNHAVETASTSLPAAAGGCGGGICVFNGADINFSGGIISDNDAYERGGGISVGTYYESSGQSVFEMTGGTISGNTAGSSGGGIFIQYGSDSTYSIARISAGSITNNSITASGDGSAMFGGGGIYVNGIGDGYTGWHDAVLYLSNVEVANNSAKIRGGGYASCPASLTEAHQTKGAVFYSNEAGEGASEIYIMASMALGSHSGNPHYEISPSMLGGGAYRWTYDSGAEVPLDALTGTLRGFWNQQLSLNNPLTADDPDVQRAVAMATVHITGNTSATRGGGIGSNGTVIFGVPSDETISLTVSKQWADKDDADGIRPTSVQVELYCDQKYVGFQNVRADANGAWDTTFADLPKYDADDGHEYSYTIKEREVEGYACSIEGNATDGFVVTNERAVTVVGSKTWDDDADRDGIRPGQITVRLMADGVEQQVMNVTERDGWTWSFENLAKYAQDGHEITYEVVEDDVPGYVSTMTGDAQAGFIIENTHEPEKTSVTVTKTWDDGDDRDKIRPESVKVQLFANGEAVGDPVELTAADNWTHTWEGLFKREQGQDVAYTLQEVEVPEGYVSNVDGFDITNTHEPEKTSVTVTKTWDDGDDRDKIRPESVKVQLFANGEAVGDPVELTAADNWTHTWEGLFKKEGGQDVAYTLQEVEVPEGYVSTMTGDAQAGFDITNTHEPAEEEPPAKPKEAKPHVSVPKAGDDTNLLPLAALAVSGVAAIGVALVVRRRRD